MEKNGTAYAGLYYCSARCASRRNGIDMLLASADEDETANCGRKVSHHHHILSRAKMIAMARHSYAAGDAAAHDKSAPAWFASSTRHTRAFHASKSILYDIARALY